MPEKGVKFALFTYSTTKLTYTNKIRFYYALKGRDGKSGILKKTDSEFLAKTVVLTPMEYSEEFHEFLGLWKIPHKRRVINIEAEDESNQ